MTIDNMQPLNASVAPAPLTPGCLLAMNSCSRLFVRSFTGISLRRFRRLHLVDKAYKLTVINSFVLSAPFLCRSAASSRTAYFPKLSELRISAVLADDGSICGH